MIQIDVEMPENCMKCNLSYEGICTGRWRDLDRNEDGGLPDIRPDWCPLHEQTPLKPYLRFHFPDCQGAFITYHCKDCKEQIAFNQKHCGACGRGVDWGA